MRPTGLHYNIFETARSRKGGTLTSLTRGLDSTRMDVLEIRTSLHLMTPATIKNLRDHPEDLHRVMQDQREIQKVGAVMDTTVTLHATQGLFMYLLILVR
jgi:hypothetical protein